MAGRRARALPWGRASQGEGLGSLKLGAGLRKGLCLAYSLAALEAELRQWDADPERISQLVGWSWIMNTLNRLPHSQLFVA